MKRNFQDLTIKQIAQHCTIERKCSRCTLFPVCNLLFNESPEVWTRYEPSILEREVIINEVEKDA